VRARHFLIQKKGKEKIGENFNRGQRPVKRDQTSFPTALQHRLRDIRRRGSGRSDFTESCPTESDANVVLQDWRNPKKNWKGLGGKPPFTMSQNRQTKTKVSKTSFDIRPAKN